MRFARRLSEKLKSNFSTFKLLNFSTCIMAAALSASAAPITVELLTNGAGTTLDGWTNTGSDDRSKFGIFEDNSGVSWFGSERAHAYMDDAAATLSQTVTLAELGITEGEIQTCPTVTASVIVFADRGSITCNVKVYQIGADGSTIDTQTVLDRANETINPAMNVTKSFSLNSATRKLKYELNGVDKDAWTGFYGPKFRNCSLTVAVSRPVNFTYVSEGATLGTATYDDMTPAAPIASRNGGDYRFLGYYTEDGVQVYDKDGNYVGASSSWNPTSDVTLYAHWGVPEGSIAKLVYRGQLNLLGSETPATDTQKYTKTMHFKVYDGESAVTPVWFANDMQVTVNKDGSFMAEFGDEALAALIATGVVTHVGVAIGENAGHAIELKPRRELRPVAAVNRALVAEGAGKDPRVGNLYTENALVANNVTISRLEVAGTVTAPGAAKIAVSPVVVGERETLTLLRGDGVNVFSKNRIDLGTTGSVQRGQKIGNQAAPSDGIALIASRKEGTRGLRIPGVIQYCRKGEYVRAPATEPDGVKVTFFPFVGSAR